MKKILLRGALGIIPLALSIWLVYSIVVTLNMMGEAALNYVGLTATSQGTGFFFILLILFVSGLAFSFSATQWLYGLLERQLMKFPVLKSIYGSIKDVTKLMEDQDGNEQKHTVLVKQANGGYMLGFVTNGLIPTQLKQGLPQDDEWVAVLYPLSYQIAGVTTLVRKSDLLPLDWEFEDAMRFMLTAGVSGMSEQKQQ